MSGGVDSSVAALELLEQGHDVVGVTMRLWAGASDTGCCSVADVDDARRVAQQLGIDHLVFNFSEDFDRHVVDPYVSAHAGGATPNPCVECNRHLKFRRLSARAEQLGFDALATGHHARVLHVGGGPRVARGADAAKDQSYVVHVLAEDDLRRTLFPVGHLTKAEVRARATAAGLRTATKPDSQDVCFVTAMGGRAQFLGERIPLRAATVVDRDGQRVGRVEAVELVTIGQRRGIGLAGGGPPRYVVDVTGHDAPGGPVVVVGTADDLLEERFPLQDLTWVAGAPTGDVLVQCSAHGEARPARVEAAEVVWAAPQRRVAPGQSVVVYDPTDTYVLGGATVARRPSHR